MTRKEKINQLNDIFAEINEDDNAVCYLTSEDNELIESAIEALEQQPCEDAISRQAAIDALDKRFDEIPMEQTTEILLLRKDLRTLPPVQPKIKVGHWIEGQTDNPNIHNILCSCCFEGYQSKGHANSQYTKDKFQWCPKCGAKMIEPQESEE
jgi:hypothetical protein